MSTPTSPKHAEHYILGLPVRRFGSLVLAAVLLAATGVIAFILVDRMQSSRDLVLRTYHVRGLLNVLRTDIAEAHADFDLYQISKDPAASARLDDLFRQQLAITRELREQTRDNPAQQHRLDQLRSALQFDIDQLHSCTQNEDCSAEGSPLGGELLSEVSGRRRSMSDMLRDADAMEESLLLERLKTWRILFLGMIVTLACSFGLALLLLFYNFKLLFSEIETRKEKELVEKNNAESYRMLSARILELQDVERRRIARELHDSVGQFLAGLKLNLGQLQRRDSSHNPQNQPLWAETIDLTDSAIGEVRTISHLLHPPLLDELGFHSAARWYTDGFAKRSNITVDLRLAEMSERLPREVELALFRVLQESLTNVHRHSKAGRVHIDVQSSDHSVVLVVSDDGCGLTSESLRLFRQGSAGGIGLGGMRERISELGGSLEVQSGPAGTEIRATLPTHKPATQDSPLENNSVSAD